MHNLRLALRTLFRTPFVTGVAVLSLALGIGANAAIFSLFDQMLLRPLPVPDPDQLVNIAAEGPNPGFQTCGKAGDCDGVFSYAMFRDLEAKNTVLSGLAGHFPVGVNLVYRNQPMSGDGSLVSGTYFPTLGLRPSLGRLLTPDDDRGTGDNAVAVLSYDTWRSRFGSDPGVVGQRLTVNGLAFTIVGVAPSGFMGTVLGLRPMVYLPLSMTEALEQHPGQFENRRDYWVYLFGRRRPGVSLQQAKAGLDAVYRPIITDIEAPLQEGMSDSTMVKFKARQVRVEPGYRGQSTLHDTTRTPLRMLLAIAGIVLLIACANIANLLLARGADRAREMGVRLALGASRRRLLAQLLTESLLLALMGGVAGLVVATGTLGGIASLLPADAVGSLRFALETPVILFAGGLSLLTGICFGLFPALHSTRGEVADAIRANAGRISVGRGAALFRVSLVTAQIALATTLLILAGLFLRSLVNVARVDLGLRVDDVVTFRLSPALSGYDSTRSTQLFERLEERLSTTPGVTGVTSAAVRLFAGNNRGTGVQVQGFPRGPDIDRNSRFDQIGPGYFAALGVPLVAGREFTAADRVGAPLVAVVNETFARKFNLGRNAVGAFMGHHGMDSLRVQIVGVVRDLKYSQVKQAVPPVFYLPWRQDGGIGQLNFYVRTPHPAEMLRILPQVLGGIDPMLPAENLMTLPEQVRQNVFLDRVISILAVAFALLATLLAAVGLYGVLAYSVQQRTREIGLRMALGANAGQVRAMVMRQVGVLLAVGGVIGLGAALGAGRAAASLLFGLKGHDPVVFSLSLVGLALVALGAGYLPARRASRVDPMEALRFE